jgi:hypothetical protein
MFGVAVFAVFAVFTVFTVLMLAVIVFSVHQSPFLSQMDD